MFTSFVIGLPRALYFINSVIFIHETSVQSPDFDFMILTSFAMSQIHFSLASKYSCLPNVRSEPHILSVPLRV